MMLLAERNAYGNRWRSVGADAKAAFAGLALVAAFVARPPLTPLVLAFACTVLTVVGAKVPLRAYVHAALAPASFLAVSAVTLAVSVHASSGVVPFAFEVDPAQVAKAVAVVERSVAALAAMLFLALTTPMTDLIALARRLRVPATLVEVMTVCYRSLFVLSEAVHDMRRAQAARLGYSSLSCTMRSMGTAVALLAVETWRRSIIMHQASVARCGGGELRFLAQPCTDRRHLALSVCAGVALVAAAAVFPGVTS